jgi:hypothetical protein
MSVGAEVVVEVVGHDQEDIRSLRRLLSGSWPGKAEEHQNPQAAADGSESVHRGLPAK